MDMDVETLLDLNQKARDFEVLISALRVLSEKQLVLIRHADIDTLVAASNIASKVNWGKFS